MFSARLQEAIRMRGVTQRWVADKSGTTEATISRYAKAVHDPAVIEILSGISSALNVSSDYLIGLTNVPEVRNSIPADQRILLDCYSKISESDSVVLWALLDKYMTAQEREQLKNSFRRETIRIG
jgi:transcriptional regulator with XRE-family HTH domain